MEPVRKLEQHAMILAMLCAQVFKTWDIIYMKFQSQKLYSGSDSEEYSIAPNVVCI